jgi:hypothetical protein
MWYAVAVGRKTGILSSWAEVDPFVTGFSGAQHQSFRHHYQALGWLDAHNDAAAAMSIVPAASDLLDPPSQAPADEADALTREQAVASFIWLMGATSSVQSSAVLCRGHVHRQRHRQRFRVPSRHYQLASTSRSRLLTSSSWWHARICPSVTFGVSVLLRLHHSS